MLAAELVTVGVTGYLAAHTHPTRDDWLRLAVLAGMALLQAESTRKLEKTSRIGDAPHVNVTSVWSFCGVIVLPAAMTGLLTIVVHVHLWVRIWRTMGTRPAHRVLFSIAVIMLSAYASAGAIAIGRHVQHARGWPDSTAWVVVVIGGSLVFLVANSALVTVAAVLHGRPFRLLVVSPAEYALEIATLYLGALAALALSRSLIAVVIVLPPLLVLHRTVLVRQLQTLASTDHKTGLLNVAAWHDRAQRELVRAERLGSPFGVLMLDLDHFKRVNDTHGHLAGDEALRAVARMLEGEIREGDAVGRFGGEEFAVLITESTATAVVTTAERLRRRVTELEIRAPTDAGTLTIGGLSVSIGVAVYPGSGTTLEQLLLAADSAVYAAKSAGRNRVVALSA